MQENTLPVPLSDPAPTDYSVLEVFGKAIGNAKVDFVGELERGNAFTCLAKEKAHIIPARNRGCAVQAFVSDFSG
ncbi:MAG: hypothetical protein A1D16_19020 [Flavihumibacter sp. CACIAM 22H1]|nr:MAG: hypothetical protein A1D16_19020 [Flavihumibacter sp. CACIAM 22H1]